MMYRRALLPFAILILSLAAICSPLRAQWQNVSPLNGDSVVGFTSSSSHLFAATADAIFRSSDSGRTWDSIAGSPVLTGVQCIYAAAGTVYAGTFRNEILRSTDEGASWAPFNRGAIYRVPITSIIAYGAYLFATTSGEPGVFRYDDTNGWIGPYYGGIGTRYCRALYHYSSVMVLSSGNECYRYDNDPNDWSSYGSFLPQQYTTNAFAADTFNRLFAATSGAGIYRSWDDGRHFARADSGVTTSYFAAIVASGFNVFAGSKDSGVFQTSDYGTHWTAINDGLTDGRVRTMQIMNGYVFVGTKSTGVWRRPLSDFVTPRLGVPIQGSLQREASVYPNPTSRTVMLQLPYEVISVRITDMLGTPVAHFESHGEQSITWDTHAVPNGTYFARYVGQDGPHVVPIVVAH